MTESWDAFICHASEDKKGFVQPLAEGLRRLGVKVWYDDFTLRVGDSLSKAIDRGISQSRFGVVVISKAFIGKAWRDHELRGLVNRDIEEDFKILPIWHGVRIPTKPATHSNRKPATDSDLKPAGVPI